MISAPVIQVALIQAASLGVAKPCATEPRACLHPPSLSRVAAGPWLAGLSLAECTRLEAGTAAFPPRGTEVPRLQGCCGVAPGKAVAQCLSAQSSCLKAISFLFELPSAVPGVLQPPFHSLPRALQPRAPGCCPLLGHEPQFLFPSPQPWRFGLHNFTAHSS